MGAACLAEQGAPVVAPRGVTLEQWRAAGSTFSYHGHPVFYRAEGSGEPLVCVHGFPTASWDWHAVWPTLAERYRLVAPDMMGFGFSAKPRGYPYSIHDLSLIHI